MTHNYFGKDYTESKNSVVNWIGETNHFLNPEIDRRDSSDSTDSSDSSYSRDSSDSIDSINSSPARSVNNTVTNTVTQNPDQNTQQISDDLIAIRRGHVPTVALTITFYGGLLTEGAGKSGLATLSCDSLLKSSNALSIMENNGINYSFDAEYDKLDLSFQFIKRNEANMLEALESILLATDISEDTMSVVKKSQLDNIHSLYNIPTWVAKRDFLKLSYGADSPYSKMVIGTEQDIDSCELHDVNRYIQNSFNQAGIKVAIAGQFSDHFVDSVHKIVGSMPDFDSTEVSFTNEIQDDIRQEDSKTKIKQAQLNVAYNAPSANHDDMMLFRLANIVLGQGLSSRYFMQLREERGFAYSVGSSLPRRLMDSRFVVNLGLEYSNVDKAVKEIENINKEFVSTTPTDEIQGSINYYLGNLLQARQHNLNVTKSACHNANLGLGFLFTDSYIQYLETFDDKDFRSLDKYLCGAKAVHVLKPDGS